MLTKPPGGKIFLPHPGFQHRPIRAVSADTADSWGLIALYLRVDGGAASSSGSYGVLNDVYWVWTDSRAGPRPSPSTLYTLTEIQTDIRPQSTPSCTIDEQEACAKLNISIREALCLFVFSHRSSKVRNIIWLFTWGKSKVLKAVNPWTAIL